MNKKQKLVTISLVVLLLSFGSFYGVKAMNLTSPQVGNNKPIVADKVMGDRLTSGEFNRILSLLKNFFVSTTNNVGIGGEPDGKLTVTAVTGITSVNGAGQAHLVLENNEGDTTGLKLRIDSNEMQTTTDGVATELYINRFGGNIDLASAATSTGAVFMGRNKAVAVSTDGKIQSDQYCDRNGLNCTKISEIGDLTPINISSDKTKVGVGGAPDGKLTITGGADINAANGVGQGHLVLEDNAGDATGWKLRMDTNEMQVSNNGTASSFNINPFGGNLLVGANATPTKVGIGGTPDAKLTIIGAGSNPQDKGLSGPNNQGEGLLVLGWASDKNISERMRFGSGEIQVVSNNVPSALRLNHYGGNVRIASGDSATGDVFMGRGNAVMVGSDGRVRSDQYCDRNGNNCTKISDIKGVSGRGCGNNEVLKGFNASGAPICRTDKDVVIGMNCPAGQVLRGFDADGDPICRTDANIVTTSNVKNGLKNVSCPAGEVLRGFDNNGNLLCEKLFTRCRNDGRTSEGANSNACAWARNNGGKGSARYRAINCEVVGYQVVQLASNLWYSGGKWQTQVSNTFPIDCTDGTILVVDSQ